MRVFVTGASGHIGSAVVPELLSNGHEVLGLARSDASAAKLEAAGASVVRGDLHDPEAVAAVAAEVDGVIHLAFDHDAIAVGRWDEAIAADLVLVKAFNSVLAGSGKPFVGTSGTLMLVMAGVTGRAGTEDDAGAGGHRIDAENAVVAMKDNGVRSSVIRLPPTVHSDLDKHGFVPSLITIAREKGHAGYVGDGANRWPAGHTLDAAVLYRLALESAPAGSRLHATGDAGVPFKDIASAIGAGLGVGVESIAPDDVEGYFGFLAGLVGLDNPTSSEKTQELLGWTPTHATLLDDMREGHYFA
jgi:nucleoside-diphosphate-sugar epimerase